MERRSVFETMSVLLTNSVFSVLSVVPLNQSALLRIPFHQHRVELGRCLAASENRVASGLLCNSEQVHIHVWTKNCQTTGRHRSCSQRGKIQFGNLKVDNNVPDSPQFQLINAAPHRETGPSDQSGSLNGSLDLAGKEQVFAEDQYGRIWLGHVCHDGSSRQRSNGEIPTKRARHEIVLRSGLFRRANKSCSETLYREAASASAGAGNVWIFELESPFLQVFIEVDDSSVQVQIVVLLNGDLDAMLVRHEVFFRICFFIKAECVLETTATAASNADSNESPFREILLGHDSFDLVCGTFG